MFKKTQYVALVTVVLLTLVLLNLPGGASSRLKRAVGSLFAPLFGLAVSTQKAADKAADSLLPRAELVRQNEALRRENQELRTQLLQAGQASQENARLRQFLGWQKQVPWKLKLANVVLREPANWWRTVEIDVGSRDGIQENQSVLTPEGLVGRIASVSLNHSQVVLIGDPACKVSVLVENTARDNGIILAGASTLDSSLVTLSFLSRNAVINPGQSVITSGLGDIFPKGIPVGTVVDSRPVEFGLYVEARVKLAANLSSLEQVCVLIQ